MAHYAYANAPYAREEVVQRPISFAAACAAVHLAVACPTSIASAQEFPTRPVRILVPLGAGSAFDILARAMGEEFKARTGQPFVVENRPGGNQVVAANALKGAEADGYTIALFTQSGITLNPLLQAGLSYDPYKDFAPVAVVALTQQVFVAAPLPGVNRFADLVKYSQTHKDTLNFATLGPGSDGDLIMAWLKAKTGGNWAHVPYRGSPPILAALKAGQVHMTLLTYGSLKAHIDAGTVKPLFTRGSDRRSPLLPNVPTYQEAGLPPLDVTAWAGIFARAGTPPAAIKRLNQEITAIVGDAKFRARFMDPPGLVPVPMKLEDLAGFLATDREAWGNLVRAVGVKPK
jgi:tripartite-type tricarboxylate transporter receptor subunit TctC